MNPQPLVLANLPSDRTGIPDEDLAEVGFVRFDPATGEILQAGRQQLAATSAAADRMIVNEALLRNPFAWGAFAAGHFVDLSGPAPALANKTACPATLDGITLRGLPVPCRVEISNPVFLPDVYPQTASEVALSFAHPGSYAVRVLSAPHLPGTFKVEVLGA